MNITPYVKAAYPVLWIQTSEEQRAEAEIIKTAEKLKRDIRIWSHTDGFFSPDPENMDPENIQDAIPALEHIKTEERNENGTIYIFRDLHPFFTHPRTVRLVRDIATIFKAEMKTLVIVSPISKIPPELDRDVVLMDFDLPTEDELRETFQHLKMTNSKVIGKITANEEQKIVQAAMGLTITEAESSFAKAAVERLTMKPRPSISQLVLQEKAAAVKKSGILEYFNAQETMDDIGGLDNLKNWMTMRGGAFTKEAREFGLPKPRGVLYVGLPGCGKSLAAKATSNILDLPLIRFDVGRVFGGLVGESEANMRKAIQTVEAVGSCVLWIDEMEKAFAGLMDSSTGDSGTSQRVFGSFITWMQENDKPVFIVSTVNRIQGLPPEMLRKGRFDEIFFVGLPTPEERKEILNIHIARYKRDPKKFDLTKAVKESEGFSGAELEFAIQSGLFKAFHNKRELTSSDIEEVIMQTTPLSISKAEELAYMAKWAEENALPASPTKDNKPKVKSTMKKKVVNAGNRQLDLTPTEETT